MTELHRSTGQLMITDPITQIDLTEIIPRVIECMHEFLPSYYPRPLISTLEEFSGRLADRLGDDYYVNPKDVQDPEFVDVGDIRNEEGYFTVASFYSIFSGKMKGISKIYYPCNGKTPYEIRRKREQMALEKTFCQK